MTMYITAYLQNNWRNILQYQFNLAKESGLLDKLDNIVIFAYPQNNDIIDMLNTYNIMHKSKVIFNQKNEYENATLQYMQHYNDDLNLYIHTKSASKQISENNYDCMYTWMKYMSFFVLSKWKECINILQDKTICAVGVDFKTSPFVHFSGNFWWTTHQHLNDICNFKLNNDRFNAEKMIGSSGNKFVSLHQSDINWYYQKLSQDKWTLNIKEYNI